MNYSRSRENSSKSIIVKHTTVLIYLLALCLLANFGRADLCQENMTISELPAGIKGEAITLVTMGTITSFLGCPEYINVTEDDVNLWLYTRNNKDEPILLDKNNPIELDPNRNTIIIIPGWLCNVTNDRVPELKDAYLIRYDANIIGVDWSAKSIALYTKAYCSVPGIAKIVGKFLCGIDTKLGIKVDSLHLVGHSLGAQMSGIIGQEVKLQCNKTLGRITGLSPAGPLYRGKPKSERLDASDAKMVDVIHTDTLILAYGRCGTVDFYPNCFVQPNCTYLIKNVSEDFILNAPLTVISCNHIRSADYMVESINSNNFTAKSCKLCPDNSLEDICVADLIDQSEAQMGEDCFPDTEDRKYYLKTNGSPPYGRG